MKHLLLLLTALFICACAKPPQTIVFNEVAWNGTDISDEDEWIELFNSTPSDIDLTGWSIKSLDGTINIALTGIVPAQGYFLLERSNDDTVPEVVADQIYNGELSNEGEQLGLFDAASKPIDAIILWQAGDAENHASQERSNRAELGTTSAAWYTATEPYSVGLGTPKAVNSYFGEHLGSDPLCNYPDTLEVTSINIGQGDATLIASKTKLLLADAGESYWNSHRDADKIAAEIHRKYGEGCNTLDYVVISHIHTDHIGYVQAQENDNGDMLNEFGGIHQEGENLLDPSYKSGYAYLVGVLGFKVGETIIRDYKTHNPNKTPANGGSKSYRNWRALFESPNGKQLFNPVTAELGEHQIDMGYVNGTPVVVDIVLVDGATPTHREGCPTSYFGGDDYPMRGDRTQDAIPPSENDYSVGIVARYGDFDIYVAGDQSGENYESTWGYRYHDTETCLIEDPIFNAKYANKMDVLRANHHGSSHSTNESFISQLAPTLTLFSVGDHNNFDHVSPIVLDTSLVFSDAVILTEIGAGVASPLDLCLPADSASCALVADDEFPVELESDEIDDPGVNIRVNHGGYGFQVTTHTLQEALNFESK